MLHENGVQVDFGINGEVNETDEEAEEAAFAESDSENGSPYGSSVDHIQGPSFMPICCKTTWN
jgi:hypothetical protein